MLFLHVLPVECSLKEYRAEEKVKTKSLKYYSVQQKIPFCVCQHNDDIILKFIFDDFNDLEMNL